MSFTRNYEKPHLQDTEIVILEFNDKIQCNLNECNFDNYVVIFFKKL